MTNHRQQYYHMFMTWHWVRESPCILLTLFYGFLGNTSIRDTYYREFYINIYRSCIKSCLIGEYRSDLKMIRSNSNFKKLERQIIPTVYALNIGAYYSFRSRPRIVILAGLLRSSVVAVFRCSHFEFAEVEGALVCDIDMLELYRKLLSLPFSMLCRPPRNSPREASRFILTRVDGAPVVWSPAARYDESGGGWVRPGESMLVASVIIRAACGEGGWRWVYNLPALWLRTGLLCCCWEDGPDSDRMFPEGRPLLALAAGEDVSCDAEEEAAFRSAAMEAFTNRCSAATS